MDPLKQAQAFVAQGREDLAAVFFAAASQQPGVSHLQQRILRRNAALLATKVSERALGVPFAGFVADHRHEDVCKAVSEASAGGKRVLILGSALGLYALAAAGGGASTVVCREANAFFEYAATSLVRAHGVQEVEISTGPASSCPELKAAPGFDVLVVAERLWGSAAGSEGLRSMSAVRSLLVPGARIVPCSIKVCLLALESETLRDRNWLQVDAFREASGLDYSAYNSHARRSRVASHLGQDTEYRPLSRVVEWPLVDFQRDLGEAVEPLSCSLEIEALGDGHVHSVATWISLSLSSGGSVISWGPGSTGETGWQYCHFSEQVCRGVSRGEGVRLDLTFGPDGVRLAGVVAPGDGSELPPYHTCMLTGDPQRLTAYRRGIRAAVASLAAEKADGAEAVHVLDIGAGSGLLSMFAASAGAKVVACERAQCTAAIAERLVEENGLTGAVRVLRARSTDLSVARGDLPAPRLIVSEIFGSDPLSEGVLATLRHAEDKLKGDEPPRCLPCRCRIWGALARVPAAWGHHDEEASACGVDLGHLAPFKLGTFLVDLRRRFRHVQLLTEPAVLVSHRLTPPIVASGSCSADLPLLPEGRPLYELMSLPAPGEEDESWVEDALCLVMWFDADCSLAPSDSDGGEMRLSTSPAVERTAHWTQFAHVLRGDDVDEAVWEAAAAGQGTVRVGTTWQLDFTSFRLEMAAAAS